MKRKHALRKALLLFVIMSLASAAIAQKSSGTLKIPLRENPGSASIAEESSITALQAFMPVFNNLIIFDQQEPLARPESIRPDLEAIEYQDTLLLFASRQT